MIIERYIAREVAVTFFGVALLLVLIYLSGTFVRLLAEAMQGDFPADLLFTLFLLRGGGNIVFILPLSLFLAVMLALGRLYQDSEMAAIETCGIEPMQVMLGVARVTLPVTLLVAALSLLLAPWAEERSYALLDEANARSEFELLAEGRFTPLGEQGPLVYVEERTRAGGQVQGIFARYVEEGKEIIISAAGATRHIDPESGESYLLLHDGQRYEGRPGRGDYRVVHFEEYGLRIEQREVIYGKRPRQALSSMHLYRNGGRGHWAELHWRIAVPISALLLGFLGVLLSKTTPRQGRFGKLFLGVVLYLIYNNLLTVARSMLWGGELPLWLGFWWVHGLLLITLLGLYLHRQGTLLALLRSRGTP